MTRHALAVAAVVAALAGCGGDDDEASKPVGNEPTAQDAPTKEEFIGRADELCEALDEKTEEIDERIDQLGPGDYSELASLFREGLDLAEDQLEELRELTPPEGDEEIVGEILSTQAEQLALGRRLADAAGREDDATIRSLAEEIERGQEPCAGSRRATASRSAGRTTESWA